MSKPRYAIRLTSRAVSLWSLLLAIFLAAASIPAQTTTGSVTGVVTDPAGAIVPGASLTLTNLDTNQSRQQETNETGAYIFTAYSWFRELPAGVPGAYRVFANFISAGKAIQSVR